MSLPAWGCGGLVVYRGAPKSSEYACGPDTGQYLNGPGPVNAGPGIDALDADCAAAAAAARSSATSLLPSRDTTLTIRVRRYARPASNRAPCDRLASNSVSNRCCTRKS